MSREATAAQRLRLRTLLDRTVRDQGVAREAILGPSRTPRLARARFAITWLARERLGISFREIGLMLGNRHHTTIMHAAQRGERLRETDPDFRAMTDRLAPTIREAADA